MSYHQGSRRMQPPRYNDRRHGGGYSPHHGHGRSHQQQPPREDTTFVLDRYGANPRSPFQVPRYRVINEVPLPCKRSEQGLIKELLRCFNCGAKDHKLSDCSQTTGLKFDREIVNMNKGWMNNYARIGAKRRRENFNARYFVDPNKGKSLDDISSSATADTNKKKEKSPTPPPTLLVWNSSKAAKEAFSSNDEAKNSGSQRKDRDRRGPSDRRRDHRDRDRGGPRERRGEYDRDIRRYQQGPRGDRIRGHPMNHPMGNMGPPRGHPHYGYNHGPPSNRYPSRSPRNYQQTPPSHRRHERSGPRQNGYYQGPSSRSRHGPTPQRRNGYGHDERRSHHRQSQRRSHGRPRGQNYEF